MPSNTTQLLQKLSQFNPSQHWLKVNYNGKLELINRPNGLFGYLWRSIYTLLGIESTSLRKISIVMKRNAEYIERSSQEYISQGDRVSQFLKVAENISSKLEKNRKSRESSLWYRLSFWKNRYNTELRCVQTILSSTLSKLPNCPLALQTPIRSPLRQEVSYFHSLFSKSTELKETVKNLENISKKEEKQWGATEDNNLEVLKDDLEKLRQSLERATQKIEKEKKYLLDSVNKTHENLEEVHSHINRIHQNLKPVKSSLSDQIIFFSEMERYAKQLVHNIHNFPRAWKKDSAHPSSLNSKRLEKIKDILEAFEAIQNPSMENSLFVVWLRQKITVCEQLSLQEIVDPLPPPSSMSTEEKRSSSPTNSSPITTLTSTGPLGGVVNLRNTCYLNAAISLLCAIPEYTLLLDPKHHPLTKQERESDQEFQNRRQLQLLLKEASDLRNSGKVIPREKALTLLHAFQECGWHWHKTDQKSRKLVSDQKLTFEDLKGGEKQSKALSVHDEGSEQRDSREALITLLEYLQSENSPSNLTFNLKQEIYDTTRGGKIRIADEKADPYGSLELHTPTKVINGFIWKKGGYSTSFKQYDQKSKKYIVREDIRLLGLIRLYLNQDDTFEADGAYKIAPEYQTKVGGRQSTRSICIEKRFEEAPVILKIDYIRENLDPKTGLMRKNCVALAFPEELDIQKYMKVADSTHSYRYSLQGLVLHTSQRATAGHYLTILRAPEGDGWYILNDHSCSIKYTKLEDARKHIYATLGLRNIKLKIARGEHTCPLVTSLIFKKNNT